MLRFWIVRHVIGRHSVDDAVDQPSVQSSPIKPADVPGSPALADLGPVFQVFRQWNLDERRVNEWRQLVQGGAVSDQPDPAHADPDAPDRDSAATERRDEPRRRRRHCARRSRARWAGCRRRA